MFKIKTLYLNLLEWSTHSFSVHGYQFTFGFQLFDACLKHVFRSGSLEFVSQMNMQYDSMI